MAVVVVVVRHELANIAVGRYLAGKFDLTDTTCTCRMMRRWMAGRLAIFEFVRNTAGRQEGWRPAVIVADGFHVCLMPVCKCYQIDEPKNDVELGCRLFGAEIDLFFAREKKWTFSRLGAWDERVYVPVEVDVAIAL